MVKVPMMPTFPDTILAETADMSLEEKGAFWDLLNHMWRQECWLKDDDVRIARLLRVTLKRWDKLKISLSPLFMYEAGKFTYPRLLDDYQHALHRIEQCRLNGKAGARKRRQNNMEYPAIAQPTAIADQWPSMVQGFKQ